MIKKERDKLQKLMRTLLESCATVKAEEGRRIEWEGNSELLGRITGTFYNTEGAKRAAWLPCRLRDWPLDSKGYSAQRNWHGFDHWKQNYHGFNINTAEQFVVEAEKHLARLGIRPRVATAVG